MSTDHWAVVARFVSFRNPAYVHVYVYILVDTYMAGISDSVQVIELNVALIEGFLANSTNR